MNIDDYKKPEWSTLFRGLSWICFLPFFFLALWVAFDGFLKEFFVYMGAGVACWIHFWFIAWCVDTFTDIRHYARETAIALTSGKEKEKKEEEDTKPTDYGSGEVPFRPSAWSVD